MPADATHAGLDDGGHSADDGHGHGPGDGHGHVAAGAPTEEAFGGAVRLRGALADATEGFLFVSIVKTGENMPIMLHRIELASASVGEVENGERVIPFEFEPSPTPGGALELKVQFDSDGFVGSDAATRTVRYAIERGDLAIDAVLDGDDPAHGAPSEG